MTALTRFRDAGHPECRLGAEPASDNVCRSTCRGLVDDINWDMLPREMALRRKGFTKHLECIH